MSVIESWFPTAAHAADRFYSWRLMPWWTSESRTCRQRSLLRLLSLAHSERLDPAPLLHHHADEQVGLYRARIRRLARRVGEGTQVIEALEQTPEVLGHEAVLSIRFAAQTGTLSKTYEDLIAARNEVADAPQRKLQHAVIYGVVSILSLGCVTAFLAIFIFPTLVQIYTELGFGSVNSGPWAFAFLLAICQHVWTYAYVYLLLLIVIAFLWLATPSRRFLRQLLTPRWAGDTVRTRTSQVLQLLAIALEAGRPVSASLSTLAHFHFDHQIRQRLLLARNGIEQGTNEWKSLSDVQLLTQAESHALATASSSESRVWALRQLAARKREQTLLQRDRSAALVLPSVTIVMSAMVLLLCSAVFGFLSYLIWALA